jgi:protein MBA1
VYDCRGDVETLRLICGEGLLDSFQKRLMARGRTRVEWRLHDYIEKPRVVSHKAALYAGTPLGIQQVVVRIHSLQVRFPRACGAAMLTGARA